MKATIRVASYLFVLAIGIGGGYYYGFGLGQARGFVQDTAETAYYSAYLEIQIVEGTDATREEALRGLSDILCKRRFIHS